MLNIYNPNQQSGEPIKQPKPETEAPKVDFRRYDDASGDFDNKELAYSMWWVKNKVLIYRILVFILLGSNVLIWGTSIGRWGSYAVGITDQKRLELIASRFTNYTGIHAHFSPAPIQILSTGLLAGGVNKYDAVAEIVNPNSNFIVTISYRFILSNTSTELYETTLLAGQSGILASLGLPEEVGVAGAVNLQIQNTSWQRVDNHKIQDAITWQDERLKFIVSNTIFQNAFSVEGLKSNRVSFNLKNYSPFSYKTPSFLVGLYNGETLVGVLPMQTGNFISMEEKPIDLRSFSTNLQVTDIKVFPQINIYDFRVFLSPEK